MPGINHYHLECCIEARVLKIILSPENRPIPGRGYIAFHLSLYHVKEPVRIVKISPSCSKATLFCSYDRLMSVSGTGFTPPVRIDLFSHGFGSCLFCLCYLFERDGIAEVGEPFDIAPCNAVSLPLSEIVRPELLIGHLVLEYLVAADEDLVAHGDERLLLSLSADKALVL